MLIQLLLSMITMHPMTIPAESANPLVWTARHLINSVQHVQPFNLKWYNNINQSTVRSVLNTAKFQGWYISAAWKGSSCMIYALFIKLICCVNSVHKRKLLSNLFFKGALSYIEIKCWHLAPTKCTVFFLF